MKKNEWRAKGKHILKMLNEVEREHVSRKISNHLFQTAWWHDAQTIGITLSMEFELNTQYIVNQAWKEDKRIAVPKTYPKEDNRMVFHQIRENSQLEKVSFGLLEPLPSEETVVRKHEIDLLVVPSLLMLNVKTFYPSIYP